MAKYRGSLGFRVYTDDLATNNPKCRIFDIDKSFSDDTVSEFQPLLIQISDGTTDQTVNLNGLTGDKFVLISDQTISVKINGSVTPIQCKTLFLDGGAITSLTISNSSGTDAEVVIGLGQ